MRRWLEAMHRTASWPLIVVYGSGLAAGAFALTWLEYRYTARQFAPELYIVLIALFFTGLGIWAGHRLTRRPAPAEFERNAAALASLGITPREFAVLEQIAAGGTNKHIARALGVSPNTVKTQVASLFSKLDVARRTEAVGKARQLRLIP